MWNPGFPYLEHQTAELSGYHRAFCITSYHYRGSPGQPGLVLGLDRGGTCRGVAYRVDPTDWTDVITYLDKRELIGYPYRRAILPLRIGGSEIKCCTYVADQTHPDYAGGLSLEESARVITSATGIAGGNRDYLLQTIEQLESHGYQDAALHALVDRVESLATKTNVYREI